jgi:hypothetical protein
LPTLRAWGIFRVSPNAGPALISLDIPGVTRGQNVVLWQKRVGV